ncbi:MAG: 4-hydroxythreonine-4-phosphate dehydrogenase PdxA, partial [Candidatus Aminicenantes bacterium]|nr:4-hydroxythreonine-4-phosphate dehydrogenase PdxA [Candidatus Aminicenantes bacterium]
ITVGDPGGIGPEIILKSLPSLLDKSDALFILLGPRPVFSFWSDRLGISFPSHPNLKIVEIKGDMDRVKIGRDAEENGRISFFAFRAAVSLAEKGELDSVVTAPISKLSWHMAGIHWAGHTEFLQSTYPDAIMSFWAENLRVALLSHHIPLREALERVTKDGMIQFIRRLHRSLGAYGMEGYTFLVAGLNPHAGESSLLGREEDLEIRPALDAVRAEGIPVEGPYPPDIVFRMARGLMDRIVIALYHDQGLIAFKLDAFETGVNATLGLPFVRTSPDHGTAFDIAGNNTADPSSLISAVRLALRFLAGQA